MSDLINVSIRITPEERKALKHLALDLDMTMSELVRKWIYEHVPGGASQIGAGRQVQPERE